MIKRKKYSILFFILIIFITGTYSVYPQFQGSSGLYALGGADQYLPTDIVSSPLISGIVIRFRWASVEITPNNFDWSFVDHELSMAKSYGKKAVLQPLGAPDWINNSLGGEIYYYIDKNLYHPTYGDTLFGYIPWGEIYIQRLESFIRELGRKYSADTTISYINAVSSSISRNLPEKIADGRNFWDAFNYNPDTLVSKLNRVLDQYMISFPKTPLWSSMDYVSFETKATGKSINYVCDKFAFYGVQKYSNRFGVWREDISGCTKYPPNAGSQWAVMEAYKDRTGAQMLWSVQDGPTRMNQCGLENGTNEGVMKAALDKGLIFGMRYFEIYIADLKDPSLSVLFSAYSDTLHKHNSVTGINNEINSSKIPKNFSLEQNYPNPFNPTTTIQYKIPSVATQNSAFQLATLKIYDLLGREILTLVNEYKSPGIYTVCFTAENLQSGVYFYTFQCDAYFSAKKMLLIK